MSPAAVPPLIVPPAAWRLSAVPATARAHAPAASATSATLVLVAFTGPPFHGGTGSWSAPRAGARRSSGASDAGPRIEGGVDEIDDGVGGHRGAGREEDHAHRQRVVEVLDRGEAEVAQARQAEDRLDEQRAAQ